MANESLVRTFFTISGLDQSYFTIAQGMLADCADVAEVEHPEAADFEQFGSSYVDLMIQIYAKAFTDHEIGRLIGLYKTLLFQKLISIDTKVAAEMQTFLYEHIGKILNVKFVMEEETPLIPSRLN